MVLVDGDDEEELRSLQIRLGDGLPGRAALERRPIVSNDAHIDPLAGLVPGTDARSCKDSASNETIMTFIEGWC
jgi:hypothetical protein